MVFSQSANHVIKPLYCKPHAVGYTSTSLVTHITHTSYFVRIAFLGSTLFWDFRNVAFKTTYCWFHGNLQVRKQAQCWLDLEESRRFPIRTLFLPSWHIFGKMLTSWNFAQQEVKRGEKSKLLSNWIDLFRLSSLVSSLFPLFSSFFTLFFLSPFLLHFLFFPLFVFSSPIFPSHSLLPCKCSSVKRKSLLLTFLTYNDQFSTKYPQSNIFSWYSIHIMWIWL